MPSSYALPLPDGQINAAEGFAQNRFVAFLQTAEELICPRLGGRADHSLPVGSRFGTPERNVVRGAQLVTNKILEDDRYLLLNVRRIQGVDVDAVPKDLARRGPKEVSQQLCESRLAGTVLADKRKSEKGSLVTTPIDTIAAITITNDHALFVSRNGTQQRLPLLPDFRVFYISAPDASSTGKVDLAWRLNRSSSRGGPQGHECFLHSTKIPRPSRPVSILISFEGR